MRVRSLLLLFSLSALFNAYALAQSDCSAARPAGATLAGIDALPARPTADPGPPRLVEVGRMAVLSGAASADPGGGPLRYHWQVEERPEGSSAEMEDAESVRPSLTPDLPGRYVVSLSVENCAGPSDSQTVALDTSAAPPAANAGPNQKVVAGSIVQLDGSASTDTNGMLLSYQWTLVSVPSGSQAALNNSGLARPVFTADLPGTYVAQLEVYDGDNVSAPANVTISTGAIPPMAQAGPNQHVSVGAAVKLNGSASTDPNDLSLSYAWSLLSVPTDSKAALTGATTATPSFTADVAGNYVAQLIVSDKDYASAPATVLVSTGNLPPVANPGAAAWVNVGSLVTLNGSQSSDPQGLALTYSWSFLDMPASSEAQLANATGAETTFTADQPGIYIAELIVSDSSGSSTPQTVVVYALFPQAVSVTLVNPTLITYASTPGAVHISNPAEHTGGDACAGQVVEISLDDGALGTLWTSTAAVATSVCIPTAMQDAAFTVTTDGVTGSTTLTGFVADWQTGTLTLTVNPRQSAVSFDTVSVGQGRAANGTLTLANPAPAGGVTFKLASNEPSIAGVSPASVTIAAGKTTAAFQVKALNPGQVTITATATAAGYGAPTGTVTVMSPSMMITIPHGLTLGPGQSLPFPVSIGAAAASAVTINFSTTAGPGSATFSPATVTIPVGATAPATQPNIVGGAFGNVTVEASATGYAPDIGTESIAVSLSLLPQNPTIEVSQKTTLTLSATSVAPEGGFAIKLAFSAAGIATAPSTVTIPAGASTVQFSVTGASPDNVTLTASGVAGISPATDQINVIPEPGISINTGYCPPTVGLNTVGPINGGCAPQLGAPAPLSGTTVTMTSSNSKLLLLTTKPGSAGAASVTFNVASGQTSPSGNLYYIGLASTGSVTVTASAAGYTKATETVTLVPSGFTVTGGQATTTLSQPSTVTVALTALNSNTLNPINAGCCWGWALWAGSTAVNVTLKDDNAAAGTLGSTTLVMAPGTGTVTTTFTPVAAGTANITIPTPPAGYTAPSAGNATTQFTVTAPPINFSSTYCPSSVGLNAVGPVNGGCQPSLGVAAPSPKGVTVTVKSSNSKLLLLSLSPTGAGSASVTMPIAEGQTSPSGITLYYIGLAGSGSAKVSASAPGYATGTQTVTLTPSGFIIAGGQATTTFSQPSTVTVTLTTLDPSTLKPINAGCCWGWNLYSGATAAPISLKNDNARAGALGASSLTIAPGTGSVTTTYTPANAGTSNISIASYPTAYTAPSAGNATTQFTVTAPPINLNTSYCPQSVGMNTVGPINGGCTPSLGVAAPSKGEAVTLTSSNPLMLQLSLSPTGAGSKSVTVNIAGGQTGPPSGVAVYYIGMAKVGTVTVTASAPGYANATETVTLVPSGFVIGGGQQTTTYSQPSTVTVTFTALDPNVLTPINAGCCWGWALRQGAAAVTVPLKNGNTQAGTLGASSLVISPGMGSATTTYTPAAPGTSNVSIAFTPTGYAAPAATQATTQFVVSSPPININTTYCPPNVGLNTVGPVNGACQPSLGVANPKTAETVTVTSSNSKLLLLSLSPTGKGSASVTMPIAAGQNYPNNGVNLYYIGLASSGTVTVTASAAGYASGTETVNLVPSGFTVTGGQATTTLSQPSIVTLGITALDPTSLNPINAGCCWGWNLRAGASAPKIGLKNDNATAGTLAASSVTMAAGTGAITTTYTPVSPGTSNITVVQPSGYTAPVGGSATTQFTVTAPPINLSTTYCPQTVGLNAMGPVNGSCQPSLGVAAQAKGVTVTITSSNPKLLLLSLSQTGAGSASVTMPVAGGQTSPNNGVNLYYIGLAKSGTVTVTASAPLYANGTKTVTLVPSGFVISGGQSTTTFSSPSTVTVAFTAVDPVLGNPINAACCWGWNLYSGAKAAQITLKNDNTKAGTLGATSLTIAPGTGQITTAYTSTNAGTSNISIASIPAIYSQSNPADATTQFVVTAPTISMGSVTVGKNLMTTTWANLQIGVPSNNYVVTVSVASSSQLLLSATGTDAGSASLTFKLSQGSNYTPQFWIYGIGSPGQANLTIAAKGYATLTETVTIDPSGFVFNNQNFSTTTTSIATTLYIQPAALDPEYLTQVAVEQLRPGMTNTKVTVTLTDQPSQGSGASKAGKITVNPVVFNGADNPNEQITSFEAIGVGQTLLQLTSPGFSNSASEVTATVTQ